MIVAMKRRPDIVHTAAESIKKMFELNVPELVVQAVSANLVPFLLSLLESSLVGCEKPTATKAVIAEALKAMQKDLVNGEKASPQSYHTYWFTLCLSHRFARCWRRRPYGVPIETRNTISSYPLHLSLDTSLGG